MENSRENIGTPCYSAEDVADAIIRYCYDRHMMVSNLKLQKILYFCQAEYLTVHSRPLFSEDIIAWAYGPVVEEVYRKYKIFGIGAIPVPFTMDPHVLDSRDMEEVGEMAMYCARFSVRALVDITRKQRPWRDAYRPGLSRTITAEAMYDYFHK